ncbi:unnamed protein product [Withania somnifera]
MVQLAVFAQGAITCSQVDSNLVACVPFLTQGGEPGAACCNGVETTTACNCVKAAANRFSNLKDAAAQSLPGKCGVSLNIPISRNVNCDQ